MTKQQLPKKSSLPPRKRKAAVRATSAKRTDDKNVDVCLKDKNGTLRAVLGLDPEGRPGLIFYDSGGRRQLFLGTTSDGSYGLTLEDATGKLNAFFMVRADGSPMLGMRESLGATFDVSLDSNGLDGIALRNESTGSAFLALDRDTNAAFLRLQTRDAAAIIDLSARPQVGGHLKISRRAMGVLFGADVTTTGITVNEATGHHRWPENPQGDVGVPRDGQSGQHVRPTEMPPPATSEEGVLLANSHAKSKSSRKDPVGRLRLTRSRWTARSRWSPPFQRGDEVAARLSGERAVFVRS